MTTLGNHTATSMGTNHMDFISLESQCEKNSKNNQPQKSGHFLVLPMCQTPHEQGNTLLVSIKESSRYKGTGSENQEAAQISLGPGVLYFIMYQAHLGNLGNTPVFELQPRTIK